MNRIKRGDLTPSHHLQISIQQRYPSCGSATAGNTWITPEYLNNPTDFGMFDSSHYISIILVSLWLFNIAMGNGPFIDGLPIKNGDFPWLC